MTMFDKYRILSSTLMMLIYFFSSYTVWMWAVPQKLQCYNAASIIRVEIPSKSRKNYSHPHSEKANNFINIKIW
jgi:hypothetical protein